MARDSRLSRMLHVLLHIDQAERGLTSDEIGRMLDTNPVVIRRTMAGLREQGYVTSEPYSIQQEGHIEPKVFLLADEGYPSYATMVFAPDSLIASKPEVVRAFVEASAKGWGDYLDGDPKAANAMILKDNPDMKADVLDQARAKLKSYGIVDGGDAKTLGIGAMTDARWETFFKMASAVQPDGTRVVPADLDWKQAYTLQFVTPKAA